MNDNEKQLCFMATALRLCNVGVDHSNDQFLTAAHSILVNNLGHTAFSAESIQRVSQEMLFRTDTEVVNQFAYLLNHPTQEMRDKVRETARINGRKGGRAPKKTQTKDQFKTTSGGEFLPTNGIGADLLLVDDPIKYRKRG